MADALLAIAIPTYERSETVAINLAAMAPEAQRLGVAIYVSDDSRTDHSRIAIETVAASYTNVHYRWNEDRKGHDDNVLSTLQWPVAQYVWVLGDALQVAQGVLSRMVAFLDDQDFVFVNSHADRPESIERLSGDGARHFLREILWHQTLTGATIYHRRVCNWVRDTALVPLRNFPQLTAILAYASTHPVAIGWFGESSLISASKESYWWRNVIDVFVSDWVTLVCAFPAIVPPALRPAALKSHSAAQGLFSLKTLLVLRQDRKLSLATLRRPRFFDVMHLPRWQVVLASVAPRWAIRLVREGLRRVAAKTRKTSG